MTECEICGWKAPAARALSPRKTFHEGDWRVFFQDGTTGGKCAAPSPEERQRWATEDQETERDGARFVSPKTFVNGSWHWTQPGGGPGERCSPPTDVEKEEWAQRSASAPRGFPRHTEAPPPGTRVYKVVTQRDQFFGGQFDPTQLSSLLNELALDGWRLVAVATADVSTFFGTFWAGREGREELVAFLEKTV